jgi:hypothetical protein
MFDEKGAKKMYFDSGLELKPFIKPILSIIITGLIILVLYYAFAAINPLKGCTDGTPVGACSTIQPYYCENNKLVERASTCGCDNVSFSDEESCITKYQKNSKNITLKYNLRGKDHEINYTVYKNLVDYLDAIPISINYENGQKPSRQDFKIKKTSEPQQIALIKPLVKEIKEITSDEKDQFRIAVSIVQSIPFGESNKTELAYNQIVYHERYPYEVLFDNEGICGEKSELLALLLKEMDYKTAIFYFERENHEAVGIRCPVEESLDETGYCFIETTGPSIITDNKIYYVDGTTLKSIPEVMEISEGKAIGENMYEYKDADKLIAINEKIKTTGRLNPLDNNRFNTLTEKYNLASYYRLK